MFSLLETTAALSISATLLASTLAALQQAARIGAQTEELGARLFAERQFEALIDRAALSAGSGPSRPAALGDVTSDKAVFRADLDGNGSVSQSGSETSAVEVLNEGSRVRLRHRLGNQTMTVVEFDGAVGAVAAYDRLGSPTLASTASLVEVSVRPGAALALDSGRDTDTLHLLFAIPEALRR